MMSPSEQLDSGIEIESQSTVPNHVSEGDISHEYCDKLRAESLREALQGVVHAESASIAALTARLVSGRENEGSYFTNEVFDIGNSSYEYEQFLGFRTGEKVRVESLAVSSMDSNPQAGSVPSEETIKLERLNESTVSLILKGVSKERYESALQRTKELPVFKFLDVLSGVISENSGEAQSVPIPKFETAEEIQVLLNKLGVPESQIEHISEIPNRSIPIRWHSGMAIAVQEDGSLSVTYDPQPVAEEVVKKTLLWQETGARIIAQLGEEYLSPGFLDAISEGVLSEGATHSFSSRYGNGYTEISRRLSVCVGKEREKVMQSLFGDADREIPAADRQRWERAALSNHSAAVREFFSQLCQVCFTQFEGGEKDPQCKTFPQIEAYFSIREGACRDAENYFLSCREDQVSDIDGVFIEKKGNGARTALTKVPVYVDNVRIPAGYLVRLSYGDDLKVNGVQPLRPTIFSLDEKTAQDAYGWQFEETITGPFHKENMKQLLTHTWAT